MFQFILKRPICFVSSLCLLLFLTADIFFNAFIAAAAVQYILLTIILISCGMNFIHRSQMAIIALLFAGIYIFSAENNVYLMLGEILTLALLAIRRKDCNGILLFVVIATSFILHLYYVQMTAIDVRQHDLSGILFYMREITEHGINFVHFNPWRMYYLFHQPLHFIVYGYIYLGELKLLGSSLVAQEGLQYVSLYLVTLSTLVGIKIFDTFNWDKRVFYGAVIFFIFNPTLFLFSGYISDDVLVFLLSLIFLYSLILWFKTDKFIYIVYAAICFGFGVLTKLSILILAPAVAVLFLYKLWYSKEPSKIIEALSVFILIAVPLSLIWILRNHILFDMAFYNIPDTSPSGQNFKFMTLGERITDFSNLFLPFINAPQVVEGNIWLALIKTELFGEWDMHILHSYVYAVALPLYFINICLKLAVIGCGLLICIRFLKNKTDFLFFFFVLIYATIWLYSFKYAMDYPYICSTDYRLFATLMLPELAVIGVCIPKKINFCFLSCALVYALLSSFVYIFGI